MICVGTSTGAPVLRFDAVLVDFAGTLVPTAHLGPETFRAVLSAAGIDPAPVLNEFMQFWNRVGSRVGLRQVMQHAVEKATQGSAIASSTAVSAPTTANQLSGEFWRLFTTRSLTTPETPGATSLLRRLHECPVQVAMVSQVRKRDLLAQLNARGWLGYFDRVLAFEDLAMPKPHPYAHHMVVKRFGVNPRQAIALERSANGLAAARTAGLATAHSGCDREWGCLQDADLHIHYLDELKVEPQNALA